MEFTNYQESDARKQTDFFNQLLLHKKYRSIEIFTKEIKLEVTEKYQFENRFEWKVLLQLIEVSDNQDCE